MALDAYGTPFGSLCVGINKLGRDEHRMSPKAFSTFGLMGDSIIADTVGVQSHYF